MKVIGYTRVSTNNQDLKRQKDLIKDYCKQKGYMLSQILEDNGISGAVDDREGYKALLSITKDDADLVIVSELSRISRSEDVQTTLYNIHSLLAKGIKLIMLDEPEHIYEGKLDLTQFILLAVKAYGAAEERLKTRTRMNTGKETRLITNPMADLDAHKPYGFVSAINPKYGLSGEPKRIWVIDEEKMAQVKEIFELVASGMSLSKTAEYMNIRYHDRDFLKQSIFALIHRTEYKGIRKRAGKLYKLPVCPIPVEIWEAANKGLEDRTAIKDNHRVYFNPLKGIGKCVCGRNLGVQLESTKLSYSCTDRMINRGTKVKCHVPTTNYNLVNLVIWNISRQMVLDKNYEAKSNEAILKLEADNQRLEESKVEYHNSISEFDEEINTTAVKFASSTDLNPAILNALNARVNKLDAQKKELENRVIDIDKEIALNNRRIQEERKIQTQKELSDVSLESKSKFFHQILDSVYTYSARAKSGVIVVNFKNGLQVIALWKNHFKTSVWYLPVGFQFDIEKRMVYVKTMPKTEGFDFTISELETKYYEYRDLFKHFDLTKYQVEIPKEELEQKF